MKTPAQLRIPQAFAFKAPVPARDSCGWVVHYLRERITRTVRDYAFFWTEADAIAFYEANKDNGKDT